MPIPDGICWAVEDPRDFRGPWLSDEEAVVARAGDKRRREFGCGRSLARTLLREFGIVWALSCG